jgi:parallel beta-helix repeat protein
MANYYVAPGGVDSNPGTSVGSPFRTVQKAADVAVAGDTCFFRNGTYGTLTLPRSGTSGNPITFKNYPGEFPVLNYTVDPDNRPNPEVFVIYLDGHSWIVLDGLRTTGGSIGILVYPGANNNQILNCEASDSLGTGIMVYGGSSNNLIRNCKSHDNCKLNWPRGAIYARGGIWGAGITVQSGGTNNIVEDCYVYWNHGEGLSTGVGTTNSIFRRNVVADNWSVNLYVDGANDTTFDSNLVYLTNEAKSWPTVDPQGRNKSNALGIGAAIEPDSDFIAALSGLRITRNVVVKCDSGIWSFPEDPGHVFSDWLIANNTLIRNGDGLKLLNSGAGISSIAFQNNIIIEDLASANSQMQANPLPTSSTFSNNIFYGIDSFYIGGVQYGYVSASSQLGFTNSRFGVEPGLVNKNYIPPRFWSDPSLSAPSAIVALADLVSNFYLTSGSVAISFGVDVGLPFVGTPDAGAFEFAPSPGPVTLTVKQNGTGNYTTIGAALANIGYAVAGAGADDIVEVYNGTYNTERVVNNNLPSGTSWSHPFHLRVAPGNTAILSSFTGYNLINLDAGTGGPLYAIIEGFTIDGAATTVNAGLVVISGSSYVRLINCEIKNANIFGEVDVSNNHVYIGIGSNSHHIEILNNQIHGGISAGHGVYNEGSNNIIQGNNIYDIGGYGIHNYSNVPGNTPNNNLFAENTVYNCGTVRATAAGILVGIGSGNQCFKNVSYNNLGADLDGGVGIAVSGTGAQIYNNTCYGNSWYGLDLSGSTSAIVRNNIAYLNGTNIETGGSSGLTQSNNFTSNPTFVNVGTGDFHLQASSAAINFGVNVGLPYSGSAPDAGAFEYSAPVVPPTAPTHQYNNTTKFYELLLADSSVVSSSGVHCLQPVNGPNGFVTFVKAGNVAQTVARKISTGAEYINSEQTAGIGGGYNRWANDGSRYIIGARRVTHGKQFFYRDLVAYIFDTQAPEKWLNFATLGRPTLDIFRAVGAGQKPLALWVKNGNQVTGFENSDPLGIVRRFTFISATLIDFVLEQRIGDNDGNITAAFVRCQRQFTLATGAMSAISIVATHTVNAAIPTAPAWLYVAT